MPSLWCDPPAHQDLTHRFIRFQDLYHNIYIYLYIIPLFVARGGEHQEHPPNFWLRGELVLLFLTRPADQSVLSSAGLQTSPKHPNISQPITILERIGRTPKSQACLLRAFCGNLARFGIAIDQGMLVDGIQRLQAFVIAKSSIQDVGKTLGTSAQQDLNRTSTSLNPSPGR